MNKVILIGNIATDIELKVTPNGNYVANFNLAVNERDTATFIPIEIWKNQAENVSKYCQKGSKVAVEGSIKIDQWEKDGKKQYFTKVLGFSVQFLDSKNGGSKPQEQPTKKNPLAEAGQPVDINSDDLPF